MYMKIVKWDALTNEQRKNVLMRVNVALEQSVRESVADILVNVKQFGDLALRAYSEKFDGVVLNSFSVTDENWQEINSLSSEAKDAISFAYNNIKQFHELQFPKNLYLTNYFNKLSKEYRAIQKVGIYIPGGTAPLVATLLMLAIPARLAGCQNIVVVTPPGKDGGINSAILYAAKLCGLTEIYKVGGAQAIAALGYGTESIPRVMKIFGPGNRYVTEAKLQIFQEPGGTSIDMPAGPSEVLVIADNNADAAFVASDLLASAEHDTVAKAILITNSSDFAEQVNVEIENQLSCLTRKDIVSQSLLGSKIIVVNTIEEALNISNEYAPEHLVLQIENPRDCVAKIQNAGSVFIGPWSAEALGDYASGPNHVLPTNGYAASYSGIGVESFMKTITFQEVCEEGFLKLAPVVEKLAEIEGLDGHKNSVTIRRNKIQELLCAG